MHVAEAALERIAREDRGRAGGVIDGIDHVLALVRRVGAGELERGALRHRKRRTANCGVPTFAQGLHEIAARRCKLRLGERDLRLDHGIVAQHGRLRARPLGRRKCDKGIKRCAR